MMQYAQKISVRPAWPQQGRESDIFFQINSTASDVSPSEVNGGSGNPLFNSPTSQPAQTSLIDPLEGTFGTVLNIDLQNDQNLQGRKIGISNQTVNEDIYNPYVLQDPVSPYQIMAGTIISASLVTGVNSDLPGRAIAQVTEKCLGLTQITTLDDI